MEQVYIDALIRITTSLCFFGVGYVIGWIFGWDKGYREKVRK